MSVEATTDDEMPAPVQLWEDYPQIRESDLFQEYITRVNNNRDMHVLFTGEGETGVGKTTAAVAMCLLCDFHGFNAEKVKYRVPDFNTSYFELPAGSWLLADDVQKWMDRRESQRKEQREQTQDIQANRVRQVFVAWTAPSKSWLEKRLGDIADFWIQCLEDEHGEPAGRARVYRLKTEEHYENELKTKTEVFKWPILDDLGIFQDIQEKKLKWLQGELEKKYVSKEEYEELKENYWNKCQKQTRFELVRGIYSLLDQKGLVGRGGEISQSEIGAAIGKENDELELKQSRISDIVNAESFEDYYQA
jgi:hypothetical protein